MSLKRRHALVFAASGAVACSGLLPSLALALGPVVLPTNPMVLRRRLSRGLRDGKAIVVTREWRVEFLPQSRGISISGQQIGVAVEAPPALARLSEIEQTRSTDSMFPILLSQEGIILAAGDTTGGGSVSAALKAAEDLMTQKGLSAKSAAEQRQFLAQLQKTGSSLLNEMPGDLFYPSTIPVRETREVALADGGVGEFEVRWSASALAQTQLLERARREVITRIGKNERRSSEDWTLSPV